MKENAYKSVVCPSFEHASSVWDPYVKCEVDRLEMIQRRAAMYVAGRHGNRSSVTEMIDHLKWESLQNRTGMARLTML